MMIMIMMMMMIMRMIIDEMMNSPATSTHRGGAAAKPLPHLCNASVIKLRPKSSRGGRRFRAACGATLQVSPDADCTTSTSIGVREAGTRDGCVACAVKAAIVSRHGPTLVSPSGASGTTWLGSFVLHLKLLLVRSWEKTGC